MIIGDEHIAVISAEGRLPEELAEETLLVTPAASLYRATIWFGHDRNVPRPIREGRVPRPVRWRRLSELASWNA